MSHVSQEKVLVLELLLEVPHVLLVALCDLTQLSFDIHDFLSSLKGLVRFAERSTPESFQLCLDSFDVPSLRLSLEALGLDYLAHLFEELLSLYLKLIEPQIRIRRDQQGL